MKVGCDESPTPVVEGFGLLTTAGVLVFRRVLFIASLGLAVTACGSKSADEKDVSRPVTVSAFGKDFVIKPAKDADPELRRLGSAVAIVQHAGGSSGTGFFVSPDGLFISNHHVLPREACSDTECRGVKLIRDFTPGGEMQVFTKMRVLVHSVERDFALLKVEIPAGATVPYLKMDTTFNTDSYLSTLMDLVVIGHPSGASMRVTPVTFRETRGDLIVANGPVFWGNSGSPLIDAKSGRVVGLVSSLDIGAHNIDRTGIASMYPQALRMDVLATLVNKLYPYRFYGVPSAAAFTEFAKSSDARVLNALKPKTTAELEAEGTPVDFDFFVGRFMGTSNEADGLAKLLSVTEKSLRGFDAARALVFRMSSVSLKTGRRPVFTSDQSKKVLRLLGEVGVDVLQTSQKGIKLLAEVVTADQPRSSCYADSYVYKYPLRATYYCQSPGTDLGDAMLVIRDWAASLNNASKTYHSDLEGLFGAIEARLDVAPLQPSDLEFVLATLERIARDAKTIDLAFAAEALHALLQRHPALVGAGSFIDTL